MWKRTTEALKHHLSEKQVEALRFKEFKLDEVEAALKGATPAPSNHEILVILALLDAEWEHTRSQLGMRQLELDNSELEKKLGEAERLAKECQIQNEVMSRQLEAANHKEKPMPDHASTESARHAAAKRNRKIAGGSAAAIVVALLALLGYKAWPDKGEQAKAEIAKAATSAPQEKAPPANPRSVSDCSGLSEGEFISCCMRIANDTKSWECRAMVAKQIAEARGYAAK